MKFQNNQDWRTAKRTLTEFLHLAIRASLQASEPEIKFGHPCGPLIETVIDTGLDEFAEGLLKSQGTRGECCLNGAGLKFWWRWEHSGRLVITVGGDQAAYYPKTVPELKRLIEENHWSYAFHYQGDHR